MKEQYRNIGTALQDDADIAKALRLSDFGAAQRKVIGITGYS